MTNETTTRQLIRSALDELEHALDHLRSRLEHPIYYSVRGGCRFSFPSRNWPLFMYLRAVRVVSAMNAMMRLLVVGHTQEMGVLARTVTDFLNEMLFAREAMATDHPTAQQQRLLEQFFADEVIPFDEFTAERKASYLGRREVRASAARQLANDGDTHAVQKLTQYIEMGFDGYVHGHYSQIMELYEGASERFHVRGVLGSPHIEIWDQEMGILTVAAFNGLTELAEALKDDQLRVDLISKRRAFEASPAYPDDGITSTDATGLPPTPV